MLTYIIIYVVNLTFWKLGASLHNIYCVNKWIASIIWKEHNGVPIIYYLKNIFTRPRK